MAKQILTILDATGKQGGSVVKSILADSNASSRFKRLQQIPGEGSDA